MSEWRSSGVEPAPRGTAAPWLHGVGPARPPTDVRTGRDQLIGTIEAQIVPRLMLMLSASNREATRQKPDQRSPEPADVAELARLLLAHDAQVACAFAHTLQDRGAPFDCLCRELFAPAARHLGELWESGQCDFRTLEFALSRLRLVLQRLAAAGR